MISQCIVHHAPWNGRVHNKHMNLRVFEVVAPWMVGVLRPVAETEHTSTAGTDLFVL